MKAGQSDNHAPAPLRHIPVLQGEFRLSRAPDEMLSTILGSCIATCIFDATAGVGGMNHFLLPGQDGQHDQSLRYGVNAMELMINALLREGARRSRLEAKVFGGARMISGLRNIGQDNAAFAFWFLENENIRCVGTSIGGTRARKVRFWPSTGQAQQQYVREVVEPTVRTPSVGAPAAGTVTFF